MSTQKTLTVTLHGNLGGRDPEQLPANSEDAANSDDADEGMALYEADFTEIRDCFLSHFVNNPAFDLDLDLNLDLE